MKEKTPLEWVVDKEFSEGELVVAVRRARVGRWSRWSLQPGVRREGQDRISQFLGVFKDRESTEEVTLQVDIAVILSSLLHQAQDYVKAEMQSEEAVNTVNAPSYGNGPNNYGSSSDNSRGGGGYQSRKKGGSRGRSRRGRKDPDYDYF